MKHKIKLYTTNSGKCPVSEFLDTLDINVVQKISWTLRLMEETDFIPKTYFKKLENTEDIWEVRIKFGSNIYRLFSFWDKNSLIILTHGIIKKTQKTPKKEIKLAESYKNDYFRRKKNGS